MKLRNSSITVCFILISTVQALKILKIEEQSCTVLTDKGRLNLKSAAKSDRKSVAFQTSSSTARPGSPIYFWNPCLDVTQVDGCYGSGQLFENYGSGYCEALSMKKNASFLVNSDGTGLVLQYKYRYSATELYNIKLDCVKNAPTKPFIIDQQCPSSISTCLKLSHPVACLEPTKSSGTAQTLSFGSILIIIALVVAVLYIIIGVLLLKFVRKSSGADLCPNRSFWFSLPFLVKDGFMFLIHGCKSSSGTTSSYETL